MCLTGMAAQLVGAELDGQEDHGQAIRGLSLPAQTSASRHSVHLQAGCPALLATVASLLQDG